jgi:O-antigen ligase
MKRNGGGGFDAAPTSVDGRSAAGIAATTSRPMGPALAVLVALWLVVLFEPQWWLQGRGITAGLRAPVVLFAGLGALLALGLFSHGSWRRRWTWYKPLLCLIAIGTIMGPFAPNPLLARLSVQEMALYWTMIVATVVLVDNARRAEFLLVVYAFQFTLWGVLGASAGQVGWHTTLSNFDGYGAFMVMGAGLCAFLCLGAERAWMRRAMALTVVLAGVGIVASFARGAFLSALAVGGVVWFRSRRKGMVFLAGLACAVVAAVAASVLHGGRYWAEMMTILQGTGEATGEDRMVMWNAAFRVFLERPILGVGGDNWGVFASEFFRPGDLGGEYTDNPGRLYGRSTHSAYLQILAEHGIAGILALGWMMRDFWRRNAALRTAAAAQRWREMGGRLRLPSVALGLEAAFVGWMGAAALYSLAGSHWQYTILALNLVLHSLVTAAPAHAGRDSSGRARRARPGVAASAPRTFGPWST